MATIVADFVAKTATIIAELSTLATATNSRRIRRLYSRCFGDDSRQCATVDGALRNRLIVFVVGLDCIVVV